MQKLKKIEKNNYLVYSIIINEQYKMNRDILSNILKYLNINDIKQISETNKEIRNIYDFTKNKEEFKQISFRQDFNK